MRSIVLLVALAAALAAAPAAHAQQKLGYVDSQVILQALPEFQSVRQEVDRLATTWQGELTAMAREIEQMERDYAARELLYTPEERDRRRGEIEARRTEAEQYRRRKFGPDGELFREEQTRMRPVQQRVLEAVEVVAEELDYGFVFDRSGDVVFLFARPADNLTDDVLERLGIDPTRAGVPGAPRPDDPRLDDPPTGTPAGGPPVTPPTGQPAPPLGDD